jgi:hypothetical protein
VYPIRTAQTAHVCPIRAAHAAHVYPVRAARTTRMRPVRAALPTLRRCATVGPMPVPRTLARVPWGPTVLAPLLAAHLALAGCASPIPSHYTRLWPEGRTGLPVVGTSTEDGVVILATPGLALGDRYELQFPHGNSVVVDWGVVDRLNDVLAVVRPQTARLREGRIASALPAVDEPLFVALRDARDEPQMHPATRWREGAYGDWLTVSGADVEAIARDQRGTGVYVQRDGRWEIVGVLAGLTAVDEADPRGEVALGFVGLLELARILPDRVVYQQRDLRPLRPDFEFGVPLQPGDLEPPPPDADDASAPGAPPPPPAPPIPAPAPPRSAR